MTVKGEMAPFDTMGEAAKAILAAAEKYPPPTEQFGYTYGTAGFRMDESLLDMVVFRVGLMAALISRHARGKTIGVMLTASHNKYQDNGVKIIDSNGGMLGEHWEEHTTAMVNVRTPEEVLHAFAKMFASEGTKATDNTPPRVIYGRDTRPSGMRLARALKDGLTAAGAECKDYGIVTTPQLHYLVKATNTEHSANPYGEVSKEGYYKKLSTAFKAALDDAKLSGSLTVDCANGVGAPALKELVKYLPSEAEGGLNIKIINDQIEKPEVLNEKCGADFIKTVVRPATGYKGANYDRCCSLDGDADRIVYWYNSEGPIFNLLDGDRIASLAANFIGELVQKAGLSEKIKISVVQTAYANGASTKYIEQILKLKVDFANTGVKHLHAMAERADVGVYFEANGHGTILFSPQTLKRIFNHEPESPAQMEALNILKALTDLIQQTIGDALSDMLLVEVILAHKSFTVQEWLATYTDMPSRLGKVVVKERGDYKTVQGTAERKLKSPPELQPKIDEIVAKYREGRCFVRASGTENAVRVYAEAAESLDCDDMLQRVVEQIMTVDANQPEKEHHE